MTGTRIVLTAALGLTLAATPAAAADAVAEGHDHYFNLEYEDALRAYYRAIDEQGESARLWNYIAATLLYEELHRLGKLETSAFRAENEFLEWEKPPPDPEFGDRFRGAVAQAQRLAEARLEEQPNDASALLSLSSAHALEANYAFMIEKAHLAALRSGNRARRYAERLRKLHPELVDALLVPGVQEYVVGSLPWAVRTLVAFGGVTGSKRKGREMVERVAAEGDSLRTQARVLLTLLHRREGEPLEAARILRDLSEEFPRNYVLRLELGAMLLDAGEEDEALEVFRRTRRMVEADEQRFGRMPERLQQALALKIEKLEEENESAAL